MNYNKAVDILVDYFKSGEKNPCDFKIGMECEHFVVYADSLEAVQFYGENGIMSMLERMTSLGWIPQYEDENIIALEKDGSTITLEPAGQLEISIEPKQQLKDVVRTYREFLKDIVPILEESKIVIMAVGYQPQSRIDDIELIPKKRYNYMYEYFSKRGRYAHNMMKGTGACHVSVDYENEEDYIKKYKVIAYLSSLIYTMFDNTPFFEGCTCRENSMRSIIWSDCDSDRCGLPGKIFSDEWGYRAYAEYMLERPPILLIDNEKLKYTAEKSLRELCEEDAIDIQGLLYTISMYFPDIRTRKYIEIRMGDALPYPYNVGYAALWKGLLYNSANLERLYAEACEYSHEEYLSLREAALKEGVLAKIGGIAFKDKLKELLYMAKIGLPYGEARYLSTLEELFCRGTVPKEITLKKLGEGKRNALRWCMLNDVLLRPYERCTMICKEGCKGIVCCGFV